MANPEQQRTLADLLRSFEDNPAPSNDYDFHGPLTALRREIEARDEAISPELVAEELAFTIQAYDHQGQSSWGIYFGPLMSGHDAHGAPWEVPSLDVIDPEVLAYWRRRAAETRHPAMRARYADLLWELPAKLGGERDHEMARTAVNAYLEAVRAGRIAQPVIGISKAQRSLEIALKLGDEALTREATNSLLSLDGGTANDEDLGLWGFCFDTFVEPPHSRVHLDAIQVERLVSDVEDRLARLAAKDPDAYHPTAAETAAHRLAKLYRRRNLPQEVARVLRLYADRVKRMVGVAPGMVSSHSLEQLYDLLRSFALRDDANALEPLLRQAGEASASEMKTFSVPVEIPTEKVESYFKAMLKGSSDEILGRIAVHFVPERAEIERELRDVAASAPLRYMMSSTIQDEDGRTVARIGPLESDLEGHIVSHSSMTMKFSIPWLRESFARGFDLGLLSADGIVSFLYSSPLFTEKRRGAISAGIKAFAAEDSVAAIHLLVPQVEAALRQLALLVGVPIYAARRGGGFQVRLLDDLLRDTKLAEVLSGDVTGYLRMLLTDARGWNVRNDVCHGLAPAGMLTLPVADRIVHALLALACFREKRPGEPPLTGV